MGGSGEFIFNEDALPLPAGLQVRDSLNANSFVPPVDVGPQRCLGSYKKANRRRSMAHSLPADPREECGYLARGAIRVLAVGEMPHVREGCQV
jgi:hypothetical protein